VRPRGINREGFAALLPVIDGHEAAVRELLTQLNQGRASPFECLSGTHFVRLVLLPRFRDRHERELAGVPSCLFFAAEFDAFVGGFLEALCTVMPEQSDEIFGRCSGYPGAGAPPAFKSWMLGHRVRPGFTVIAHPGATADEVQRCLLLREQIIEFAVETQGLDAAELSRRWAEQPWEAEA
jgi:hypothetical protein